MEMFHGNERMTSTAQGKTNQVLTFLWLVFFFAMRSDKNCAVFGYHVFNQNENESHAHVRMYR